jgi:hypothetical protein
MNAPLHGDEALQRGHCSKLIRSCVQGQYCREKDDDRRGAYQQKIGAPFENTGQIVTTECSRGIKLYFCRWILVLKSCFHSRLLAGRRARGGGGGGGNKWDKGKGMYAALQNELR